jgi:hypothetical protein
VGNEGAIDGGTGVAHPVTRRHSTTDASCFIFG